MPVYAIQAGDGGPVKVGVTRNVASRLRALQTAQPMPLRLLHVWEGGAGVEREIHRRLAAHNLGGEWFSPVPELVSGEVGEGVTEPAALAEAPIRTWRTERGLSQTGLAKLLGCDQATVCKWESGDREPAFAAMARMYDVTDGAVTADQWLAWWRTREGQR